MTDVEIKISVIIPVYNVEKYIDNALTTLTKQNFSGYEIILTDDGSTDSSGEICDRWAKEHDNIQVIHKPNGGVASARNAALEFAKGEYIYFMDPDDYIEGELFAENYAIAKKYDCDEVIFGFKSFIFDSHDAVTQQLAYPINIDGVYKFERFQKMFLRHLMNVHNVVWNRLYKREFIGDMRFEASLKTAEDAIFNMALFKKGFGNIYYNNKLYYVYLCREHSLMTTFDPMRFENNNRIMDTIYDIAKSWSMESSFKKYLAYHYVETFLYEYSNAIMPGCTLKKSEIIERIKNYSKDERVLNARTVISLSDISSMSLKVLYILSNLKMYNSALAFKKLAASAGRKIQGLKYRITTKRNTKQQKG